MDFVTGGDNAFRLVHPDLLTGAASSAGGAFYYSGPGTISVNPAITAAEQRIMLNLGYTTLLKITDSIENVKAQALRGSAAFQMPLRTG